VGLANELFSRSPSRRNASWHFLGQVEWLAGIAQAQQPQGEASPSYLQVCSCAELDLLNKEPFLVLSCSPQSLSPPNIRKPRERFRDSACNQDPECLWSKRFIETKARLQGAQSQQRTLQRWHSEILGGCGQDTSYDLFPLPGGPYKSTLYNGLFTGTGQSFVRNYQFENVYSNGDLDNSMVTYTLTGQGTSNYVTWLKFYYDYQ